MTARLLWTVLKVALVTLALVGVSLLTLVGVLAGIVFHKSRPKTVEVIRYVTVLNSSSAPQAPAPEASLSSELSTPPVCSTPPVRSLRPAP